MANLGADEQYCSSCGNVVKKAAVICPKCGVKQQHQALLSQPTKDKRSRIVAALLALFLGWFGAHKFYLGRPGWGLIYLIFCWTFIPAIIAFIEFILLLLTRDDDFDRKFNAQYVQFVAV